MAKKREIIITCNAKQVQDTFDFLNKSLTDIKAKMQALNEKGAKDGWTEQMKKEFAELEKMATSINNFDLAPAEKAVRKFEDVLKNLAGSTLKDVKRALNEGKSDLNKMAENDPKRGKLTEDLAKIARQIEIIGGKSQSLAEAKKQLSDLVNTPTAKLEQGLAAINKELATNAELSESDRAGLKGMTRQYEAQLAVNQYGKAGVAPMQTMTDEQLRAEQSRLRSLYMSTQGAAGFEGISKDALDRLQKANQLIKDRAEAEREAARAAKEADEEAQRRIEFAQQGQRTHQTLANMEKASYEDLEAALKHLQEQYKTYASGDVKHIQRNLAAQDQLKQRMKDMQSLLLTEQELSDRVNNRKKYNIVQLQQAYDQLKVKLSNLAVGETEAIEKTQKQMKSLQKEISKAKGELTGFAKLWNTALKNIGAYMGVFAAFGYVKNKIMEVTKGSIALSDAMAQVQKVTGLSKQEVDELNKSFAKLDTRTTITQLNDLAFSAGKMGLGKYGLEGIEGFVKATNQLQVALGDDLGNSVEEAITPLAKLAENMGLIQKMGVEKSMMAIGSSINELSQTTTAAGRNIVDFTRRIQPTAQMLGLTVDQVLALGSASDAFGISAEVSATAFTKFLSSYRTNTDAIEQALGIAKGTLDEFYNKGKTIEGLMLIFQRMHDIGDIRVLAPIFKELGSEGSKMFETFGSFSKNIDQLRDHVLTSELAFEEATSVTREYNLVQDTAAGILERANNIWEKAFVNPEGVDMVKQLTIEWYNLSKELTNSATWIDFVQGLMKRMVFVVETLIKLLPTLVRAMFFYGVAQAVRNIYIQFTMLNTAMATATTTAGKLSAFMKSNLWVLAGTAIMFATSAIYDMATASSKAKKEADAMGNALKKASDEGEKASAKERAELKRLYDATQDQKKAIEERTKAALELKRKYPDYFADLTTEQILAGKAADAYQNLAQQILNAAKARAMEKKIEQLQEENINLEDDNRKREQWRDDNQKKYEEEKAKIDRAVDQQNRMETAGASPVGGKMGYVHATNAGDKQLVGEYQANDQAISDNSDKIKENTAVMERLSEEVSKIKPTTTSAGTDTFIPQTSTEEDKGKGGSKKGKEIKDKFDEQKKQVEGLIAKIDELYNLQEAAVRDAQSVGQMTQKEADDLIQMMEIARNEALMRARNAIGTGSEEDVAEWKKWAEQTMPKLVVDSSKWSSELYDEILNVDTQALSEFLSTIHDPKTMAKLDASSFFDTMRKKAAESKKKSAVIQAKLNERANQFLRQYQLIDAATEKMQNELQTLGFMTETAEEMAKRIANGGVKQPKKLANGREITDREAYAEAGAKFIGMGTIPYRINIENEQEALDWFRQFATNANKEMEDFAQAFPRMQELVNQMKTAGILDPEAKIGPQQVESLREALPQIQALYYQMESYASSVADTIKKQVDQMYGRKPIGLAEMGEQHEGKMKEARYEWQKKIDEANASDAPKNADGDTNAAVELKKQRDQQLIEMEYQYQQELYQIREQMGVTQGEQYQHEVDMYKNMLDKKLISEKQFQQKKAQLQLKLGLDNAKMYNEQMSQIVDTFKNYEITETEDKYDRMIAAAQANGQETTALEEQKEAAILDIKKKYAAAELAMKIAEIGINTAAGIMQAWVNPGYPGAIPLTVMIGALGAAQTALAIAEYNKVMGQSVSSKNSNNASTTQAKTKLVSGMLTYEKGNVDKFAGRRKLYDDGETQVYGRRRYLGEDGKVYTATAEPAPKDGLVTHPIATTVQGQPALVAENGPEIVIGRETTKAIMMNEPELIKYLANYQQHGGRRLFDSGNAATVLSGSPAENTQPSDTAADREALRQRLDKSDELMAKVLYFLQHPVRPQIDMYSHGGEDGLYDSMQKATKFMSRYGG